MDQKELKKILAGFAVAGLLAGAGAPGAAYAAESSS